MLKFKGHEPAIFLKDCKTEAQRQLKIAEVVEPHGFCVACMLHCHDGHEVHELYSKLDFRCDCGNGRFPMACQIDGSMPDEPIADTLGKAQAEVPTFEGKPNQNSDNRYNMTFFDIYCVCKQPHSAELIDSYML